MPSIRNLRSQLHAALNELASQEDMSDKQSTLAIKEPTMLRALTDYSTDDFAELLVDVDALFAGFSDPEECKSHTICPTFSNRNVKLKDEGIVEGEWGRASHIYIDDKGWLCWRFKSLDGTLEGNMGYDGFNAVALEDQFPEVAKGVEAYLLREHGADLRDLWRACHKRYGGKPQMVDLANERITYGRKMRACNLLEQEANAKDAEYEADDNYGIF